MSSTTATAQQTIKAARGWHVSMALPKLEQARQYRRILRDLGYQTCAPEEQSNGYVIKFRARLPRVVGR